MSDARRGGRVAAAAVLHTLIAAVASALALASVASPVAAASISLGGSVQYETFGYPDPNETGGDWENFFEATLRARGKVADGLTYRVEARAVADDTEFTAGGFDIRNENLRRPFLGLTYGVLDYRPLPGLRLSAGRQMVNWSTLDEIQPANVMSPSDESDIFRRTEQGVYGLSLHYGGSSGSAELVVVPFAFMPSRLPQGRWNIISDSTRQSTSFRGQRLEVPPVRPDETQAGLRLGKQIGELDLNLIGYVGRHASPIFVSNLIFVGGLDPFEIEIVARYSEVRAGGYTASYPIGESFLLRSETVYFSSPDTDRENFFQYVPLGVEYVRGDWRLNLNYLRYDRTDAAEEVTDKGERSFFRSFLFGQLRYDAGGRFRAFLQGGRDLTEEFLLLEAEVSYRVWGEVRLALVGNLIDAGRFSYFDRIRHEDRVGLRTEVHF